MQRQGTLILVLALSAALVAPVTSLSSQSAASAARQFLRNHADRSANPDELAELKGENPEAYALVKALLTKRSLGLLNPRHPTASFAPGADQQQATEQGPEVFQSMLKPGELEASQVHHEATAPQAPQVALPYAAVQPAAHKDWMNWKPQDSALNDDQMVANVLGAVAELKGKKAGLLSKRRDASDSTLSADEASFGTEAAQPPPAAPQPPPATPVVAAVAAPQENSYLKGIDFGLRAPETPEKPETPKAQENSYLKGIDLSGDMPEVVAPVASKKRNSQMQDSSSNLLAFSWDDSKPVEQPKVEKPQPKAESRDNTLLSWLGVVRKAPEPKAAPAEPAKPSNPYLMDLSN